MNTATDAIYTETRRTPLVVTGHAAAVKFAIPLSTSSSDKLSRKAYDMLVFDNAKARGTIIRLVLSMAKLF